MRRVDWIVSWINYERSFFVQLLMMFGEEFFLDKWKAIIFQNLELFIVDKMIIFIVDYSEINTSFIANGTFKILLSCVQPKY